jgi:molybdate transport system permease protein
VIRVRSERPPVAIVVPALVALILLLLPLVGLVMRTPYGDVVELATSPQVLQALRLSLVAASLAAVVCVVLGVPLAWILARVDFPGRNLIRGLVTVPLVLPPVIGGVALLVAFGRNGLAGRTLESWFGVQLPFTTAGVVIAAAYVAMPFLIISVEGALRSVDERYEAVAATLGASAWMTFRRVTLPAVGPAVLAGAVLSWARALGEFGATITFAGSFPGTTRTLPLAAYAAIGAGDRDTAVVLSLILLMVSVVVLVALRGRWLVRG